VAKIKAIKTELKHRHHDPIPAVGEWLHKDLEKGKWSDIEAMR
jgi:hypothetical protein